MARKTLPTKINGGQRFSLTSEQEGKLGVNGRQTLPASKKKRVEELCLNFIVHTDYECEGVPPSRESFIYKTLQANIRSLLRILSRIVRDGREQHGPLYLKLDKLLAGPISDLNELSYAIICLNSATELTRPDLIYQQLKRRALSLGDLITYIIGQDDPQSEAVYVELVERFAPPRRTGHAVEVIHRNLLDLERAAAAAGAAHKAEMGGRGRPPQEAFREFIWRLADVFENIGGKARVWQRHDREKLDSPFMRWVTQLCDYLPDGYRPDSKKLPEQIHSVTEARAKLGRQKKH